MKYFYFILLSLSLNSCIDCEWAAENMREEECVVIVDKLASKKDYLFLYSGKNPYNGKKCSCVGKNSYRWWNLYRDYIEIGDTIIKNKGELTFNIRKKDTILSFNFECDGKVYK